MSKKEVVILKCTECKRNAVAKVYAKWPSKKMHKTVCGYHLRPYKTSEFRRVPIEPPKRERIRQLGYEKPVKYHGYAPV